MLKKSEETELIDSPSSSYTEFTEIAVEHPNHPNGTGNFFLYHTEYLPDLHGCVINMRSDKSATLQPGPNHQSEGSQQESAEASSDQEMQMDSAKYHEMHERIIDSRLLGIEKALDARMESMQRFQEQAEARFQRSTERHEADISLARQQIHQEFKDARQEMSTESQANRKHSTQVAIGTIAGVLTAVALVAAVAVGWMTEQGTYAKSYGETQVDIQSAADERDEFREAVQSIQATQQSILDRLPPPSSSPSE